MSNRREFIRQMAFAGAGTATGVFASNAMSSPALAQAGAGGAGFAILIAASDAPQSMKNQADFVCTGTNDQKIINNAIASLIPVRDTVDPEINQTRTHHGGVVQLSPGTFKCGGPIKMRPRTSLIGSGRGTILMATASFGGVIEANSQGIDKVHVAFLTIDGNGKNVHGIYFNITEQWFDDESPDAANHFTDLYVWRPKGDGIHITGSRSRATYLTRVRVWQAGGYGYYLDTPDSNYVQCETGGSGKSGFYISKSNNRFTVCKSWYSYGDGYEIHGSRNQFSACESQDNAGNGFYIEASDVTLTSCHADSNNWFPGNPSLSSNTQNKNNSGFRIADTWGFVQLIGCQAYDKNENDKNGQKRGYHQSYGFYLEGYNAHCQITGLAKNNRNGLVKVDKQGDGTTVNVTGRNAR